MEFKFNIFKKNKDKKHEIKYDEKKPEINYDEEVLFRIKHAFDNYVKLENFRKEKRKKIEEEENYRNRKHSEALKKIEKGDLLRKFILYLTEEIWMDENDTTPTRYIRYTSIPEEIIKEINDFHSFCNHVWTGQSKLDLALSFLSEVLEGYGYTIENNRLENVFWIKINDEFEIINI